MRKILVICSLLLLVCLPRVQAHRLNEYLQATRIALNSRHIDLHMDLTAGSGIADKILMNMDPDGDGVISLKEQASYVSSVLLHINLLVDGRPARLQVVSFAFPTVEAIKNGIGDVQVHLTAVLESGKTSHQLILQNGQPGTVVYLVNCLMPEDPHIDIGNQSRNNDQSLYTVSFTTNRVSHGKPIYQPHDNLGIIQSYFVHGVRHILTGYDHLLFLCALVLGAAGIWDLIKIITAFTIAHSVTLTLAVLGWVYVPESIIEPLIAISIVYVAIQNIFWPKHAQGTGRIWATFLFGLSHGLGFAGGLIQLMHAMPASMLLYAILGFSVGIEAGNQVVLIPLYGIQQYAKNVAFKNAKAKRLANFRWMASAAIAVAGIYYLFISLAFPYR